MEPLKGSDSLTRQSRQFVAGACGAITFTAALGLLLGAIGHYQSSLALPPFLMLIPLPAIAAALAIWILHGSYPERLAAQTWMNLQLVALAAASLAFGGAAAAANSTELVGVQALALAFLLAACSGPTFAMAANRAAISLWLVPLVAPSCIVLCSRAEGSDLVIALTLLLVLLLDMRVGLITHHRVMATLRYREENELLVVRLRDQMNLVARVSEEKTRFLASAAHDLRQPLHALGLFGASLEQRLRDRSEGPLVRSMQRAIEALENSFSSILDISRLDAGVVPTNVQAFPIRDLFRRMYLQYAGEAERRDISLRFRASGRIVKSDPLLLERILSNLIQNALRYTQQGGGVLVAARRARDGVRIEVWDTGIGISPDKLELIFEEFYQIDNPARDRAKGIGMGLSIVRRICSLLGIALEVHSRPQRGSLFRLSVPAGAEGALAEMQLGGDTLPPRPVRNFTVMVIDDEEPIRRAMEEFLVPQQIRVLSAGSIAEAVDLARDSDTPVDVIFSDLRLRAGEDGIRAIQEVRNVLGVGTPAVLLTGDTTSERLREAHESGLIVIYKPLQAKQVLELINRLPA